MTREQRDPSHYIRQYLEAKGWTQAQLAESMKRPLREISEIVAGHRDITPEIASGLARAFDTTQAYWMNQQIYADLMQAAADD